MTTNAIAGFPASVWGGRNDLGDLKNLYRAVIGLPDLSSSNEKGLTMQGTVIAAANEGWLPALTEPGPVLAQMTLLTAPASRLRSEPAELPFRFEASARWHIAIRDSGFLGRLVPFGALWNFLAARGGDGFAAWTELVGGAGLMPHFDRRRTALHLRSASTPTE